MLSSPIESDRLMVSARESEALVASVDVEREPGGEFATQRRGLLKRLLPRTMFGRSLLIVVVPLVLLQAIAAWVVYDRHWAADSWRLSAGVVGDVALMIEAMKLAGSAPETARLLELGTAVTALDFTLRRGERLPPPAPSGSTLLEEQLVQAMQGRVDLPYRIDAQGDPRGIEIDVQ